MKARNIQTGSKTSEYEFERYKNHKSHACEKRSLDIIEGDILI